VNILITSASRKVTLVEAFQTALEREGGGNVVAVDASRESAALYVADDYEIAPYGLDSGFLDFILSIGREKDISLLIPTRDEELLFFAARRDELEEAGMTVMVPSRRSVEICQDKYLFLEHCTEKDFLVPEIYEDTELEKFDTFPVFVRERFGKGSVGTYQVETHRELETVFEQLEEPIVQEYVDAPEYTVDLFADFQGEVISVVPRERVHVFGGESFVGCTVRDKQIISESIRLSESLDLVGHNTIQCFRRDNDEVHFIEVNPRYGGGSSLGFASGAFTPQYLVRLLQDEPVSTRIGKFKEGTTMLRYTQDLFLDKNDKTTTRSW
jgi:carbamoyl-phosphate synthase large subunit